MKITIMIEMRGGVIDGWIPMQCTRRCEADRRPRKMTKASATAEDVLDELDYFCIQDELDGTYHAADVHDGAAGEKYFPREQCCLRCYSVFYGLHIAAVCMTCWRGGGLDFP